MVSTFPLPVPTRPQALGADRPRASFRLSLAATAIVALGLQVLQACTFGSPQAFESPDTLYKVLTDSPYVSEATMSGDRWRVIDGSHFKADHGYTCASAPNAASEKYIGSKLADMATLPDGFDGTVFLNGWYLEYAKSDHHVVGLGAVIFDIEQNGNALSWHAGGVIGDRLSDDEYTWCYQYTILAWARPPAGGPRTPYVDIKAAHADATGKLVFVDPDMRSDAFTSRTAKFRTKFKPRAKLLAGFGTTFDDDDHHLLQFAFDLGTAKIKRKLIKWNTDVILKDNSTRSYGLGGLVTVIGGASVRVVNPDFVWLESGSPQAGDYAVNNLHLTPSDDRPGCLDFSDSSHIYQYRIDDVPYSWAVPMLTGWDVGHECNDEHVKKIGAWIESFNFVPNPQTGKGTLHYTVRTIMEDKQPETHIIDGAQVEILGINLLQPNG